MNKKASLILALGLLLFTKPLSCEMTCKFPLDQIILTPPGEPQIKWKQINHVIDEQLEFFEYCPPSQKAENWSELASVQCFYLFDKNLNSIDELLAQLTKNLPEKTTWTLIEKDKDSAIYEYTHGGSQPIQHELTRTFFMGNKLYNVGFTKKDGQFTVSEKKEWIKLLKENVVVSSTLQKNNTSS